MKAVGVGLRVPFQSGLSQKITNGSKAEGIYNQVETIIKALTTKHSSAHSLFVNKGNS